MAFAAMALVTCLSIWRATVVEQSNKQIELENKTYRTKLGFFKVEDRSKYYALKLADRGDTIQRFRVWLPDAGKFQLRWADDAIPQTGLPGKHRDLGEPFPSGMYDIEVRSWKALDKKPEYPQPRVEVDISVQWPSNAPGNVKTRTFRLGVGHRDANPDVKYLWRGDLGLTPWLAVKPASQPLIVHGVRWVRVVAPDILPANEEIVVSATPCAGRDAWIFSLV